MAEKSSDGKQPITIKKYANRRLYNTATSSYVTLDHLCQMVQEGVDFVVYDAKSGEDITRSVLTQIIVEEESKGQNLLPINFLRQLISFYGDSMQWMVPRYLDHMMEAFSTNQERIRQSMQETFGGMFPFGDLEQMGKQNMALFERTLRMFTPFNVTPGRDSGAKEGGDKEEDGSGADSGGSEPPAPGSEAARQSLEMLQRQVDLLQKQLQSLQDGNKKS